MSPKSASDREHVKSPKNNNNSTKPAATSIGLLELMRIYTQEVNFKEVLDMKEEALKMGYHAASTGGCATAGCGCKPVKM